MLALKATPLFRAPAARVLGFKASYRRHSSKKPRHASALPPPPRSSTRAGMGHSPPSPLRSSPTNIRTVSRPGSQSWDTTAYYRGNSKRRGKERSWRGESNACLNHRVRRARGMGRRLARLGGGKSKSGSERWVDFRSADVVDSLSPFCDRMCVCAEVSAWGYQA